MPALMKRKSAIAVAALLLVAASPSEVGAGHSRAARATPKANVEAGEIARINDVYVAHFVVDGTNRRAFERALSEGKLPNLEKLVAERGARFTHALSSFPTTSTTVYQSYVTGLVSGRSGIPHLERFDREAKVPVEYLAPGGPEALNDDIFNLRALHNPDEPSLTPPTTIFELLRGHPTAAVYSSIYRGASDVHPKKAPLHALWSTYVTGNPDKVDILAFRRIMNLYRGEEIPRYLLAGLYSADIMGHLHGPESDEVVDSLLQFDIFLGEFMALLSERGIYDKTYVVVSSDHGMHGGGEIFEFERALEDAGVALFGGKGGAKNSTLYAATRGVSSSHFYVKHDGAFAPISDPKVLRRHPTIDGETVDLARLILSQEATDLLVVRAGDRRAKIFGSGGAVAESSCRDIGFTEYCSYRVEGDGGDPLKLGDNPRLRPLLDGLPHPSLAWRDASAEGRYPDAVVALTQIFDDGRGGDAFVTAQETFGFQKVKAGNHGGPTEDDMRVALFVTGPTVPRGTFGAARPADLYPLLLEWFGLSSSERNYDGVDPFSGRHDDALSRKLAALDWLFEKNPSMRYMIDVPGFVKSEVQRILPAGQFKNLLPAAREEAALRSRKLDKIRGLATALDLQASDKGAPRIAPPRYLNDHRAIVERARKHMESAQRRMEDVVQVLERCASPSSSACLAL
ncbi:MAG TPA: alkaline phosphatase family protein [bacterium]|nr:alkaline phosphatase family protein [bacterium]